MPVPDIAPKPRGRQPSLLDPASMLQNAQRDYDKWLEQQNAEAEAFALGQQTAAQQAQAQYQQAQQAPMGAPISPMAALPYMANAFAAGFSNNPQLAESGDRAFAGAQNRQRQQRSEELSSLRESYLMAAQQAREAGDFARESKYRESAEKHRNSVQFAQRAAEREAEQEFTAERDRLNRSHDNAWKAKEYGLKVWEAAANNPATRAQIEGAQKSYENRVNDISEQLALVEGKRDARSMQIASGLREQLNQATREFNGMMSAVRSALGSPDQGAGAPNAAPPGGGGTPSPAPTTTASGQPGPDGFANPFGGAAPPTAPPAGAPGSSQAPAPVEDLRKSVTVSGYQLPVQYVKVAEELNIAPERARSWIKANKARLEANGYDPDDMFRAIRATGKARQKEAEKTATRQKREGMNLNFGRSAREGERVSLTKNIGRARRELAAAVRRGENLEDPRWVSLRDQITAWEKQVASSEAAAR